ncbi:uncharacterized protein LOC113568604, partial [Electrophorus electricus]|uniref:uncharacterized protein LOC113568604 n=1 Tax=Electrophorus electricus TaxID=8005 RepID=UPI0015D028DF
NLTVEDSGTYQCAVDIKRWTDKYKAVKLKVKAEPQVPAPSASSSSSSNTTAQTTSKTTVTTSECIEIPISTSTPHSSSRISPQFTKTSTSSGSKHTSASSPDTGFPSSTVISVVCVTLVLLLMGTSFLIVTFRKRSKMQASCKGQALQDISHNHEVPLAVFDYEEIKDPRHNGAPTVYSTVCLPTNPSDPSKTVYALAQPPSCSHDMDIYSTAQLPTTPSDSSVGHGQQLASTSAEGLI